MKTVKFVLIAIFLLVKTAKSQEKSSIKWGGLTKNETASIDFRIFNTKNGFLCLRFVKEGEFLLEEFNKKIEKIGSKEIELDTEKSFKRKTSFLGTFEFNSKWYMFFTHYDKEIDQQILYAQEIAKEGFKNRVKIASYDAETSRKQQDITFSVVDSNTVVVLATTPFESKKEPMTGSITLLDKNLKKVKEKKFSTLLEGKVFDYYSNPEIDKKGNLYFIAYVYQDRGDDKRAKLELVKYDLESNKFLKMKLGFPNYGIYNVTSIYLPSLNKIIAVGLLSKESDSRNSTESTFSSAFYQSFDLNEGGKVEKEKVTLIPQQEMAKLIGERKARKEKEARAMSLKKLYVNENGTITLMGEIYYVTRTDRQTSSGVFSSSQMINHFFKDVLVATFDSEGSFGNVSIIPKDQATTTFAGSLLSGRSLALRNSLELSTYGYLSFYHNGKPTILFNDDIDNCPPGGRREELTDPDPFRGESKCSIVIGKFDERGKLKATCEGKQIVEDEQLFLKTNFYHKLDDDTFLLLGTSPRGKVFAFGTLTFTK